MVKFDCMVRGTALAIDSDGQLWPLADSAGGAVDDDVSRARDASGPLHKLPISSRKMGSLCVRERAREVRGEWGEETEGATPPLTTLGGLYWIEKRQVNLRKKSYRAGVMTCLGQRYNL